MKNPFKMKMKSYGQGKNPIAMKSPMKDEGKERLAKQKIRTEKNKAFYDERSSEFSKDDSGVYRDTKGLSVSERRRISNKEKRRLEREKSRAK